MVVYDLIQPGTFVGVGLILRQAGRFMFGIRPPKIISGETILEITGIGGKLEANDPGLIAGVQREAIEEISAGVKIIPCPRTLVVRGQQDIEQIELSGDERPAALVFRHHRTPPHHPWHPDHADSGLIAVFLAELLDQPQPSAEIPYMIWLSARQILATASGDIPLDRLVDEGAELITGAFDLPPLTTLARLTDSQEALSLALDAGMLDFYAALDKI